MDVFAKNNHLDGHVQSTRVAPADRPVQQFLALTQKKEGLDTRFATRTSHRRKRHLHNYQNRLAAFDLTHSKRGPTTAAAVRLAPLALGRRFVVAAPTTAKLQAALVHGRRRVI
jgi:hypothetical protein